MTRRRRLLELGRGALLENFWLKLIALLFALGFYGFIHSAQNMQRTLKVAVVAEMPARNVPRVLISKLPTAVNVTVVGARTLLDGLRDDSIYPIQLDLSAAQDVRELALGPELVVGLPPGVRVTKIVPSRLEITWEDKITRELDVRAEHVRQPLEGLEVRGPPVAEPPTISVHGPASVVNTLQLARAQPFDASGLGVGKHTRLVPLIDKPDEVAYDPTSVQLTMEIARKLATRTFADVKIDVVGLPRATPRPVTVRVTVTGAPDRIAALRPEEIVARVEPLATAGEPAPLTGSVLAPVKVDVPDADVELHPPTVVVKW
jgi:hypothetical protein